MGETGFKKYGLRALEANIASLSQSPLTTNLITPTSPAGLPSRSAGRSFPISFKAVFVAGFRHRLQRHICIVEVDALVGAYGLAGAGK